MEKEIKVSISYVTYNHSNYVKRAIYSFIEQDCQFNFEILITDDASIDGTQDIIKYFHKLYPNLIKPKYNKTNQFRNGAQSHQANFERAKGKYVALCDGDDFWIDPNKLSKQIKEMEKSNSDVSFHAVEVINPYNSNKKIKKPSSKKKFYSSNQIIWHAHRLYTSVVSIIIKNKIVKDLPAFYNAAPTEDHYLLILGSLQKEALFLPECMACYDFKTNNSWSERNPNLSKHHFENLIAFIGLFFYVKKNIKMKLIIILKILELFIKSILLKSNTISKYVVKRNLKSLI